GVVTASTSHIVEGCDAGYQEINYPVCNFTEGYLQGAYHAVTGESVYFTEKTCLKLKEPECTFILDKNRNDPIFFHKRFKKRIEMKRENKYQISNIDEDLIVHTVSQMPLFGNEDGLIPAFNVYLANMPVDFYNLICLRFLEDMEKKKLLSTAQNLLVIAGEICAINTLRGFMNSREWKSLVEPMIKEESDNIFGLVALTNSLGWGNWHICEHEIEEKLIIESLNSYEATGFLKYKNEASISQCYTLRGVATGMMELLYTDGSVEERIGSYDSEEYSCVAAGNYSCKFKVMPI
ncbi:MAG: 4-vinyl reductase, partial [Spirochaetia bacterium]|nr:4-vinyl reductase [Spirochaetia bacterium]